MALSDDQIAKLKEHIKNKLIEIGSYVDDQLPDYVMIMVTNKKSEKQMIDDLDLFLGGTEAATKFIEWLHAELKRITSETSSSAAATSKSSSSSKIKSAVSRKTSNQSLNQQASHDTDELAIQVEADDEFNEDFGDDSAKNRQKKANNAATLSTQSAETTNQPPSSSSQADSVKKPSSNSGAQIQSRVGAVFKRDQGSDREQTRESTSHRRHNDSSNEDGNNANMDEDGDSDDGYRRKRKLSSSVSGGSGLSSVVRVSERKYAVPRGMQANKNILLKAVDAANTSVGTSPSSSSSKGKSIADLKLEELRAKRKLAPSSERDGNDNSNDESERRDGPSSSFQTKRLRTSYSTSVVTGHFERDQASGADKRKAIIDENSEKANGGLDSSKDLRKVQIETNSALKALDTNNQSEPKFIVTLTGLDEDKFARSTSTKGPGGVFANRLGPANEVDDDDMIEGDVITAGEEMDLLDEELVQEEQMDNENTDEQIQKKKLTRCVFWPQCDKGDQCVYLHPNKQCTAFPNCQFGNQCHFLHPSCRYDGFCTRLDCPYTHLIKKPMPASMVPPKINISVPISEAGEQSMDATTTTTAQATGGGKAPKITINKIQPIYSLVNKPPTEPSSTGASESSENPATGEPAGAAAPGSVAPFQAKAGGKYRNPTGNPFYRAAHFSNQFSFVNRPAATTTTTPSVPINCKFGIQCKNLKCPYIHPNVAQKQSQFKWTATSSQPSVKPELNSVNPEESNNQVIIS